MLREGPALEVALASARNAARGASANMVSNGQDSRGKSKRGGKELKSKALNDTKELQFLKQQVEDLKNDNAHETEVRLENEKQIKLLKEQVEDLRKITAPEKCLQLVRQGVTRGTDIFLDSDGVNHGK